MMSLEVDIKKNFPDFSLQVRFSAEREILGMLGASGSGKSMTLKCIAGIETPDEGVIVLNGEPLFDSDKKINVPPQRRRTGYLFQNAALFPNMTVEQNLMCVIKGKTDRAHKRARAREFLTRMDLDGLRNRYPRQLSGGQQQRAALARILLSEPDVIMLDEPFSALDSYLRWLLELELSNILGAFGGTSIFVSHDRDEVYRLCGRIVVIADGAVAVCGDKWDIFTDPKDFDACLLTGCKNISPAEPAPDGRVTAVDWAMTFDTDGRAAGEVGFVGVRAHDIALTDEDGLPNSFEFEVVSTLRDTFSYILRIRRKGCPDCRPMRLEMSREKYEALRAMPRYAHIPGEKILYLDRK
jgi:molybdate transport system ATP-binding protein